MRSIAASVVAYFLYFQQIVFAITNVKCERIQQHPIEHVLWKVINNSTEIVLICICSQCTKYNIDVVNKTLYWINIINKIINII